jgi:hypothetical protein
MTTGQFRSRYLEMHELRREALQSSCLPESFSSVSAAEGMLSSGLCSNDNNCLETDSIIAFNPTTFCDNFILHRTIEATRRHGFDGSLLYPEGCQNKHMRSLIKNAHAILTAGFDFPHDGVLCCTDIYTYRVADSF